MEKHWIYPGKSAPPVQLLYINGPHRMDSWINEVNIPLCKVNLFVEGHSYIIVNGRPYVASPGDAMIYRPHDIHYGNIPYEQTIEYFELLFEADALKCFPGGDELAELFEKHPSEGQPDAVHLTLTDDQYRRLKSGFYRLLACVRSKKPLKNPEALSLLLELLCGLHGCRDQSTLPPVGDYYPASLLRALDFIHQHLTEELSNQTVSEACFVSPSYLNRIFRKYLHCTPHDYILSCRLAHARNLLSQGCTVTEACYSSGFRDSSSFGSIFKKHTGMLPSHYRKGHASEGEELRGEGYGCRVNRSMTKS